MLCNKCGSPIIKNGKFCSKCGTPVNVLQEKESDIPKESVSEKTRVEYYGENIHGFSKFSAIICIGILIIFDDSEIRRFFFALALMIGLLFPLKVLFCSDLRSNEQKLLITSGVSSFLTMLVAFLFQRAWSFEDFIDKIFYINTFPAYLWIYIILLVAFLYYSGSNRKVALFLSSILIGITIPFVIVEIIVFIVVLFKMYNHDGGSDVGYDSYGGGDN